LASLEAEVLLLGIWKNVAELEESINLHELRAMIEAMRQREERQQRFAASLKGIDLGNNEEEAQERFARVQARANAKLTGNSIEQIELNGLGFSYERED